MVLRKQPPALPLEVWDRVIVRSEPCDTEDASSLVLLDLSSACSSWPARGTLAQCAGPFGSTCGPSCADTLQHGGGPGPALPRDGAPARGGGACAGVAAPAGAAGRQPASAVGDAVCARAQPQAPRLWTKYMCVGSRGIGLQTRPRLEHNSLACGGGLPGLAALRWLQFRGYNLPASSPELAELPRAVSLDLPQSRQQEGANTALFAEAWKPCRSTTLCWRTCRRAGT